MRTSLNLSRKPFTNHRVFWIVMLLILIVNAWTGLWISAERSRVKAAADQAAASIKAQEGEVKKFNEEQERLKREQEKIVMGEREAVELAAARQMIGGKAFSWNRLISDIERYVPNKAKVTAIQVTGARAENGIVIAQVEIKALGQAAAQLTEMMESLDKSGGLFQVGSFGQEAISDSGEVPFTLRVTYTQSRGEAQ